MRISWVIDNIDQLSRPLVTYLTHHCISFLRCLFFGGALLLLACFWYFLHVFSNYQGYAIWLAGFAATLALLFVFTVISARINGYRSYRDPWLGTATGIMFMFSIVLVIVAQF